MSKHLVTSGDVVSDLWRCVYFSEKSMTDPDFLKFFALSKKAFDEIKDNLDTKTRLGAERQLIKAQDTTISKEQRREHLLTAAQILL